MVFVYFVSVDPLNVCTAVGLLFPPKHSHIHSSICYIRNVQHTSKPTQIGKCFGNCVQAPYNLSHFRVRSSCYRCRFGGGGSHCRFDLDLCLGLHLRLRLYCSLSNRLLRGLCEGRFSSRRACAVEFAAFDVLFKISKYEKRFLWRRT